MFCPPADTEEALYEQLANRDIQEITKSLLTLEEELGNGEFGRVYRGHCKGINVDLAIKVTNEETQGRIELLQEAVTMGQFLHPRILRLYGLVTIQDPVSVSCHFL